CSPSPPSIAWASSSRVQGVRTMSYATWVGSQGTTGYGSATRVFGAGLLLAAVAALSACSGGSGADVAQNPSTGGGPTGSTYNGPAPATPDVQAFKINLWENIRGKN